MNEAGVKVIEAITNEIAILERLIRQNNSVGLNDSTLRDKIKLGIENFDQPIVIETLFANYNDYLEQGQSQQGKPPPIDKLRDWALSHGIPTDNSTLLFISRAIIASPTPPKEGLRLTPDNTSN